ncbi:hypothetical protein LDENG_00213040 [Lucifuga dentata]|nr:hypothetical protein LDENG_00213040 [Lucifuga dentata]
MKPLPGDRTGRWRKGVCLQLVAPRSYLVSVEGNLYRRNHVDLRPAEKGSFPIPDKRQSGQAGCLSSDENTCRDAHLQKHSTQDPSLQPGGVHSGVNMPTSPRQSTPATPAHSELPRTELYKTRSGRVVKTPCRLDL